MNNREEYIDDLAIEKDTYNSEKAMDSSILKSMMSTKKTKGKESKERAGTILKKYREQQGVSLEVVHEATKIPMDALHAIEEGYKIRMLSPFYYSGFLKIYAHYLNVDASEVIEDYKQEELPGHIEQEVEDEEFQMPRWVAKIFTRQRKRQMVVAAGLFLALFLLFKMIGFFTSRGSKPAVGKEVVQVKTAEKKVKKVKQKPRQVIRKQAPVVVARKEVPKVVAAPAVRKPKPKPVKPAVSAPPAVAQRSVNLTVRANQTSWLRVRVDGIVVFQSTLRIGAVETWLADKEIEISGRNINQLEFELNGKMIGTLGRNDRNANGVVITKDGLSIKRRR